MAYNEALANRTREFIALTHDDVNEIKMFSGLCFMVNEKMCVGVLADSLMVRFDPALHDELMNQAGCMPMKFTKKTMKGMLMIDINELNTSTKLAYWINLALDYNVHAKKSKPKKKK